MKKLTDHLYETITCRAIRGNAPAGIDGFSTWVSPKFQTGCQDFHFTATNTLNSILNEL